MAKRVWAGRGAPVVLACALIGCSGGEGVSTSAPPATTADPLGTDGDLETDGTSTDDSETGATSPLLDVGASPPDAGSEMEECASVIEHAAVRPNPQDIMIFVDNSTSMAAETAFVQEELNNFSRQISDADVDARILLFSSYPGNGHGICIEPPLGSGGCPEQDSVPPNYIHIDGIMESGVFTKLVERYAEYSPHLREDANLHIVAITDFDAGVPVKTFLSDFNAIAPELADFTFHGIIAPEDPGEACANGTSCCGVADQKCAQFQEIIALTGGVEGNLCDQEFQPIFDALAEYVVGDAELACSYTLPVDQAGDAFDKDQVNVEFEDGLGGTLELGRVDDATGCASVSGGWYYDNPLDPTQVHVCPQTCEAIQGFDSASIAVIFGCATIPAS